MTTNDFQKILDGSNRKPKINGITVSGKNVVAERFLKALKNKIYKYLTSILENLCINK